VPLSEHEQRLLEQMERALSAEDPKLVSALTGSKRGGGQPRTLLAVAMVLLGVVVLFTGLIAQIPLLGILGFVIALSGTYVGVSSYRSGPQVSRPRTGRSREGFLQRLERRWETRE
jgi:hypothetical protein